MLVSRELEWGLEIPDLIKLKMLPCQLWSTATFSDIFCQNEQRVQVKRVALGSSKSSLWGFFPRNASGNSVKTHAPNEQGPLKVWMHATNAGYNTYSSLIDATLQTACVMCTRESDSICSLAFP